MRTPWLITPIMLVSVTSALQGQEAVPDLTPTEISLPSEAIAGTDITYQYSVGNVGTAMAVGPWTDSLFLSADSIHDGSDLLLLQSVSLVDLAPAEVYSSSQTISLPRAIQGDFYFVLSTDSGNAVSEGPFEGNNQVVSGPVPITIPEPNTIVMLLLGVIALSLPRARRSLRRH